MAIFYKLLIKGKGKRMREMKVLTLVMFMLGMVIGQSSGGTNFDRTNMLLKIQDDTKRIIGIVSGCIVLTLAVIIFVVLYIKRQKKNKQRKKFLEYYS